MGRCAAVVRAAILAAGASARMGRPKAGLVLPDNGDTFVRRLVRTFGAAGFADIVVVTGAVDEPIRRAAGRLRGHVRFVHNRAWEAGQLTSLQAALDADSPGPPRRADLLEAIAVTLVDAPLVTPDTVRRVLAAWRLSRAPIVRPARGDVHGHPVIFDRAVFAELRAADPAVGAKSVVRAHADRVLNVPVDDAGAFLDIDTEDDYRRAIDQLSASDRFSRSV